MRTRITALFLILLIAYNCRNDSTGPPSTSLTPVPYTFMTEDFFCLSLHRNTAIITSQGQYDSLISSRDSVCHPFIDFAQFTLLGQRVTAMGCDLPDYQVTVLRDDLSKRIIFNLLIVEHGNCQAGILGCVWILIPKLPESYTVDFEKDTIIVGNASSPSTQYLGRIQR